VSDRRRSVGFKWVDMGIPVKMVHKLFLAILLGIGTTAILLLGIAYWSVNRGLLNYVNRQEEEALSALIEPLAAAYRSEGSWEAFSKHDGLWRSYVATYYMGAIDTHGANRGRSTSAGPPRRADGQARPKRGGMPPEGASRRPPRGGGGRKARASNRRRGSEIGRRILLLDQSGKAIFGPRFAPVPERKFDIEVDGEVVGRLAMVPREKLTAELDLDFLKTMTRTFLGLLALLFLISAVIAMLLARHWGKRLQVLADGARALSAGEFSTRVWLKGQDELAKLGWDFNNLANTLGKIEKSRQRWMAEISHELRTPLAILRGELEALQDGVRQYRPEMLESLLAEVHRLNKLVEDLYELSRADLGGLGYRKSCIDALEPLRAMVKKFQPRMAAHNLRLEANLPERGEALILADIDRLGQLFANLLENAMRYTNPGGLVRVTARKAAHELIIEVADSAPGLEEAECQRVFSHFVRGSSSESFKSKGSGLGLAICKSIVKAHEGRIEAVPSSLGGVSVVVKLPLEGSYYGPVPE